MAPTFHISNSQYQQPLHQLRPQQTPLYEAIDQGDLEKVQRLLEAMHPTPDALSDLLKHACSRRGNLPIKTALLAHPQVDLQLAIELAVRLDEIQFAFQILKKDVVPQRHHFDGASREMRTMLAYARRKSILYPTGDGQYTDLDNALQKADFKKAGEILRHRRQGATVREAWANAVKANHLDILRALLVLGEADLDRGFRLEEDPNGKIKDPGLLAVMKELPHHSPRRGMPRNLNGKVPGVYCRQLVEHRQARQANDPRLKSDDADFQDEGAIKERVHVSEETIRNTRALADEVHLVDNREFGSFVTRQFEAMEKVGKTSMQLLMISTNHAMSLELLIKKKTDQMVYVVKFYDPNLTNTHLRSASASSDAFASQDINDIRAYMSSGDLKKYFPESRGSKASKGVSMLFVRPSEGLLKEHAGKAVTAAANRTLASPLVPEEIDATVMWHLLTSGFAGNLRGLKEVIASRPPEERAALLAATGADGTSGLHWALIEGHADAINAFGELLNFVSEEDRLKLLATKRVSAILCNREIV